METLAIHGGQPVRDTYLSYGKQTIEQDDIEAVVEVLKSDYLTTGPFVKAFEEKVANYVGAKYAVAVSNGTAALHMAAFVSGIQAGDEVLVPALTFAASANCVRYCGAMPVFVDIHPKTYNMDIEDLKKKITSKTKAIIPVDFAGQSVEMDEIMAIAKQHQLLVIEDAAHALGGSYKGKKIGTEAHLVEFSFHPVKPVTTAEGGVVVTNDEMLYNRMMKFRTHGITRVEEEFVEHHGSWYYEQQFLGYNYRLTDVQAALGSSQMAKIDRFIQRRRDIAKAYDRAFAENEYLITPYQIPEADSGWHIYVIRLNLEKLTVTRKEIFNALQKENIGVNVHYLPVYLMPYYQELGYAKGLCPEAEKLYDEMITLPIFPTMTDQDVADVIKAVEKVTSFYRK